MQVLERDEWRARADAHHARIDALVADHLDRRRDGVKHPVHDFLFTYYSFRPAQLRRWHPGYGVVLADAPEYDGLKGYARVDGGLDTTLVPRAYSTTEDGCSVTEDGCTVTGEHVASQRPLVESIHALLEATAGRAPQLGCFGLHEWAMVHRAAEHGTRHAWPLRLGGAGTDAIVESHRITCSHFDAFRFFTPTARGLNVLQPGRDDRAAYEQPGCLHGNMDLYKTSYRLLPMVPSEWVVDAFVLARDIRELDMRASPYDLSDLGSSPVKIETPEGKREYVDAQRAFAERAQPLRQRLIEWTERLLAV